MDGYLEGALGNKLFSKEFNSKSSNNKVVVVQDFGASLSNYEFFASLLSKYFDVLLYDIAGQGKSEGSFSLDGAVSDLEKIISSQTVPVAICAHSFGARIASELAKKYEEKEDSLKGVYMIQPCLGRESFGLQKNENGTLSWVMKKFSGRKNPLIVQTSDLSAMDCILEKTPVGYMIANKDDVLLMDDDLVHNFKLYHSIFKFRFVGIDWNDSIEVKGLNHWLNLTSGGGLLKDEEGKNSADIVEKISYFFMRVFEKN
jgi:pimeloyl-ACP methyl ester carboxylesterase